MTMISLRLPDSIHVAVRDFARRERISINQFVTLAVAEKIAALQTEELLEARAARGNRAAFERVLAQVPDVEPEPYDRLPATLARVQEAAAEYRIRTDVGFDEVWQRIVVHAGEIFHQKRGREFTYTVKHGHLSPSTTNQLIARSQVEGAFRLVPLENTKVVQHLRAPSYLYAILMDKRIRQGDW